MDKTESSVITPDHPTLRMVRNKNGDLDIQLKEGSDNRARLAVLLTREIISRKIEVGTTLSHQGIVDVAVKMGLDAAEQLHREFALRGWTARLSHDHSFPPEGPGKE